jgi:hypothetical protein
MTWIDVTDVIEFLETEPLVTAIQPVAVDLTTARAAYRQRRWSIEQGVLKKQLISLRAKRYSA